jgi:MFS family permease
LGLERLSQLVPGALLVPLISSWSDRVRRERLLTATLIPRALLLGASGAAMGGHGQAMLVAVLVALDGGLCSVFRPVQAALLPWLARTPDELTSANTAASMMQAVAMLVGPTIGGLYRAPPPDRGNEAPRARRSALLSWNTRGRGWAQSLSIRKSDGHASPGGIPGSHRGRGPAGRAR